jgi:hypothetical protein
LSHESEVMEARGKKERITDIKKAKILRGL